MAARLVRGVVLVEVEAVARQEADDAAVRRLVGDAVRMGRLAERSGSRR